ncbi:zinc metalloprotease [Pontimicrobium sp. MEBiC06410]
MKTKKLKALVLFLLCMCACGPIKDQTGIKGERNCGTMNGYQERIKNDAEFARNERNLENTITNYVENIRQGGLSNFRSQVVTIPVVVHVVYNTSAENISDAQIQSQIANLNRDFRRNNADASTIPSAFSGLAADSKIEFKLAQRDENCNPTTGITRTNTSTVTFSFNPFAATETSRNPVKFASSGGVDGWDSSQYLNMWVCNLSGTLLGYGSFPSDLASRPDEDGVVMDYQYFGDTGTATAPFDMGRTAVHEIGHWLNLRHIWGDDGNACTGSDQVADTPNQAGPNYSCPSFPSITCGNGPNGDMYMNFMDYVNDDCMTMFTLGQSERMDAVLYTTRASIVSSQGDIPPPAIAGADLFSKDTDADVGNEPNNESTRFYRSEDMWVRNTNDGLTNEEHQNPIGGATNYVYVKVRNRGCTTSASANVRLYWAKASTGLSWPTPWDGSVGSPVYGSPLGVQPTGAVSGSGYTILEFQWNNTPNPNDYAAFGADKAHFCLLSRIETSSTAPYGMTSPETTNLGNNVKNNNNIVWKNVTVSIPSGGRYASVLVSNYTRTPKVYTLRFDIPRIKNILNNGELYISPESPLIKYLKETGQLKTKGIEQTNRGYLVADRNAQLLDFKLDSSQTLALDIEFITNPERLKYNKAVFEFEVEQYNKQKQIGGQHFAFKVEKQK